jgi:hypothetical protein
MSAQHRLHNGSFVVAAVTRDRLRPDENDLAHRDERNLFVLLIARDALRARVEHCLAIDQKLIVMMALWQDHLRSPAAVDLPLHRSGVRMPVVKIADERNLLGGVDRAKKVDGLDGFFGGKLWLMTEVGVC